MGEKKAQWGLACDLLVGFNYWQCSNYMQICMSYIWTVHDYGSITISYPRNLKRPGLSSWVHPNWGVKTPITVCREVVNPGSVPYLPTSPSLWGQLRHQHINYFIHELNTSHGSLASCLMGWAPWRGQRDALEPLLHLYPSHTPQWCRGSLPTHKPNAPAQQDQKITCRAADAMGFVLPEQEHREGAKFLWTVLMAAREGRQWGEPCGQAGVCRNAFSFSLNPLSKPFPFAKSLCKH